MSDKIVTCLLTRHGQSTSNYQSEHPNPNVSLEKFRNAGLSPYGMDSISYWRNDKLSKMGNIDYIFTSPLKRAIETCLLTHIHSANKPVYVMSLLTEFGGGDSEGDYVHNIKTDVDIITFPNYNKLEFDKYFWVDNPHQASGIWWEVSFRDDLYNRMNKFKEFLKNPEFTNKSIAMYAHGGIFGALLGIGAYNYQTTKFKYNQETGEIFEVVTL